MVKSKVKRVREKITNLLQNFHKEEGYNIFIFGLTIVLVSNYLIKILSIKHGIITTKAELISFKLSLNLFKNGILLGKFISVIGIIKTLADLGMNLKRKLKKEDQKC